MSGETTNIMRLLLHEENYNKTLGADIAVGIGSAEQILEHLERELKERLKEREIDGRIFTRGGYSIAKINYAIWALKTALGKPIYLQSQ